MPPRKPSRYSLGLNGHAHACDCVDCAKARVQQIAELWRANGSFAEIHPTKTVFVRSYFRRDPRHLARRPNTRAALKSWLRSR